MTHTHFLKLALNVAAQYRGRCAPNPAVGAVLVKNNEVIATGVHRGPGSFHAERDLLSQAITITDDMTLYVTLEPCRHHGRTPPCTDIIIEKNIHRVVFAHKDINANVATGGQQILKDAGVQCEQHIVPEVEVFYRPYDYWHQTHMPFVTAKLALSKDEKIAGENGAFAQITGDIAKQLTHQLRLENDAILTTAETVIKDDPQLNCRLLNQTIAKPIYILDRRLRVPKTARVFSAASKIYLLHARKNSDQQSTDKIIYQRLPDVLGRLDWQSVLKFIAKEGVQSLWVESGGEAFESLYDSGFLNAAYLYQANKTLGAQAMPAFMNGRSLHDFLIAEPFDIFDFDAGDDKIFHLIESRWSTAD